MTPQHTPNKGQAALEYLITYGWAVMTVMILLAGLYYFGIINPRPLLPESCSFGVDIACQDYQIVIDEVNDKERVSVLLHNVGSEDLVLESMNCTLTEMGGVELNTNFYINDIETLTCERNLGGFPTDLIVGDKFRSDITLIVHPVGGFARKIPGQVFAQVRADP